MDPQGESNSDAEMGSIENEKQERIKALLVRIGEKSASPLAKNLEMLSRALCKDLPEQNDFILEILFQCIVHLTTKTGVYGTLVGLLNLSKSDFGELVVERLVQDFKMSLATKDFARINILIRFSSELMNSKVITKEDFFAFIDPVFQKFVKEKTDEKISDFFFYCLIGILPYSGKILSENAIELLEGHLKNLSSYFSQRSSKKKSVHLLPIKPSTQESSTKKAIESPGTFLEEYWRAIVNSQEVLWESAVVLSPHRNFAKSFENSKTHSFKLGDLDNLSISETDNPQLCNLLRIFSNQEVRKSGLKDELSRLVLFEYYVDIILYFEDSIEECIRQLLYITDQHNSHALLVETVLSLLLQLPYSQSNATFYGLLIIELFKAEPKVFPRIIGEAVNSLFENIDLVDYECRDRLSSWFAFHLSNFKFKWAWSNWSFTSGLHRAAPMRIFHESVVRNCSELCMGMGKNDEVKIESEALDSSESAFAYPKALILREKERKAMLESEKAFGKDQKNDGDEAEMKDEEQMENKKEKDEKTTLIAKTLQLLEEKADPEEILKGLTWLKQGKPEKVADIEFYRVFFSCVLQVGKDSFSNLFRLFDRIKPEIAKQRPSYEAQKAIVEVTLSFWKNSHIRLKVILLKLVTYGFIQTIALIEIFLSEKILGDFFIPIYSTILTNLINLFTLRISALRKILEKEIPEDKPGENKKFPKDILMEKISRITKEREMMVKTIIERLALAINHFQVNIANYETNELYKAIFGRFVMFIRKYGEVLKDVVKEMEEKTFNDKSMISTKTFYEIN